MSATRSKYFGRISSIVLTLFLSLWGQAALAQVVAVDDGPFTTAENQALQIDVDDLLANDSGPDNDLQVVSVQNPVNGSVSLNGSTVTFTPDQDFVSPPNASFTYTIESDDNGDEQDTATVTIEVQAVDDPVTANDDGPFNATEDQPLQIDVADLLANDDAPDGGLELVSVQGAVNGSVSRNGSTVTFTPDDDFSSPPDAGFTYTARDDDGDTDTATVTIDVDPVNDPPDANNDSVNTDENTSVDIFVLDNDSDPDGDDLTIDTFTQPANGTVVRAGGDRLRYTPDPGFSGNDSFDYTIADAGNLQDTATVTIDVQSVDDPVTANDDGPFNATEDQPLQIDVADLLANDSAPDGGLELVSVQGAVNGSVSRNGSTVTFTPDDDFFSPPDASFTYTARDDDGDTDTATVTIDVAAVNDPPVANDDSVSTNEDTAIEIRVLDNDSDPDGDDLDVDSFTQPANGAVERGGGGGNRLRYTPDPEFSGSDSFDYTIVDEGGAQATATVTVDVQAVDEDVTAVDDGPFNTNEDQPLQIDVDDLLANDSAPDGGLELVSVQDAVNGSVSRSGSTVTFTPDENFFSPPEASFRYTVRDGDGDTATATVRINVQGVDEAVNAQDDGPFSIDEDQSLQIDVADLLANDNAPDGGLELVSVQDAVNGTVNRNGSTVTFTPDDGFFSPPQASFAYTVRDDDGDTDSATVTIQVRSVDDPVEAVNDGPLNATEDQPLQIDVADLLANDSAPDGGLELVSVQDAVNGSVSRSGSTVTFTPDDDFSSPPDASFSYTIRDADGDTDSAMVLIDVRPVNDPPVAVDDNVSTPEDTEKEIAVLENDSDPDDGVDSLRVVDFSQPSNGFVRRLSIFGSNRNILLYTPDQDISGIDSFTYTIEDPSGERSTATVTVDVGVVNDPPTINSQVPLATPEETPIELTLEDFDISDPDDPPSAFRLIVLDGDNYSVDGTTVTPAPDFDGELTVRVRVTDGTDDSDTFNAIVQVEGVNDPPVILSQLRAITVDEDTSLAIDLTALEVSDPDNDYPDDFTLTVLPGDNYQAQGNSLTPIENFVGTLSVPVIVNDGFADSDSFTLTVGVDPVNDPPMFSQIPDQQAVEGLLFQLDVSPFFSDVDEGDELRFEIDGLPASGSLSFDGATGLISGTPGLDDAMDEPYPITVAAIDLAGERVEQEFGLTIARRDRVNLALAASVSPSPAFVNEQTQWLFEVSNAGPAPALAATLNVEFTGGGLTPGTVDPGCVLTQSQGRLEVECQLSDIAVGGSLQLVIPLSKSGEGDVLAVGRVENAGPPPVPVDPDIDNNSAALTLNVGQARSNGATQTVGLAPVTDIAVDDVTGDAVPDVVVSTPAGFATQIFAGDGIRSVAESPLRLGDASAAFGVALGDFDQDQDQDILLAISGGSGNELRFNDGAGDFQNSLSFGSAAVDIAVGDFDSNQLPDLATAGAGVSETFVGNGSGGLTAGDVLGDADARAIAIGDIDGDGRDDVLLAGFDQPSQIWYSTGGGSFAPGPVLGTGGHVGADLADFNNDGRLDVVLASVGTDIGTSLSNPVYLNTVAGFERVALLGLSPTTDIRSADINGDGNQDMIAVNATGTHQVFLGNGAGLFSLAREQIPSPAARVANLSDLDQDGDIDLILGLSNGGEGIEIYLNDGAGNLGLGDAEPPVIVLEGESTITVVVDQEWTDPGFTATDNVDGDLTEMVDVDDPVNERLVGSFTVTYTVEDTAGNQAVATRTVIVEARPVTSEGGGGGALGIIEWLGLLLLGGSAAGRLRRRECS